jgi:DbpA RNA binding domain
MLLYMEPLPARLTKGELLAFLCATGSIDGKKIGRIELRGATAVVEIPDGCEAKMVKALDGASLQHRRLRAWSGGGLVIGTVADQVQAASQQVAGFTHALSRVVDALTRDRGIKIQLIARRAAAETVIRMCGRQTRSAGVHGELSVL